MQKNINNLNEIKNTNTYFNRDITTTTAEGELALVCRCYATIVANKSISWLVEVVDIDIFNANKSDIQAKVDTYKSEMIELAKLCNVPLI